MALNTSGEIPARYLKTPWVPPARLIGRDRTPLAEVVCTTDAMMSA